MNLDIITRIDEHIYGYILTKYLTNSDLLALSTTSYSFYHYRKMLIEFCIKKKTKSMKICHLINLLDDQPLLYTLKIGNNNTGVIRAIDILAKTSDFSLTIKEFDLSNSNLNNNTFDMLDFDIFDFIESLDLQNCCKFTCKGLKKLLMKLYEGNQTNLTSLNLSRTSIGKYSCISLAAYMKYGLFDNLKELDVSFCNLNSSLVILIESLHHCKHLELLDINNCNGFDDTLLTLGKVMETNSLEKIKYLDLSWNNFGLGSLMNIMKAFSLGKCKHITYFNCFMTELQYKEWIYLLEAMNKGYLKNMQKLVLASLSSYHHPSFYTPINIFESLSNASCMNLYSLCIKVDQKGFLILLNSMKKDGGLSNVKYLALDTDSFRTFKNTKKIIHEISYMGSCIELVSLRIWFSRIVKKSIRILANAFKKKYFLPNLKDLLCVKSSVDDTIFIDVNKKIWMPLEKVILSERSTIQFTSIT